MTRARAVVGRHAQDPGLEELALAGAGGPADQRMRALVSQVEVEWAVGALADQGAKAVVLLERLLVGLVGHRLGLAPPFDDRIGGRGQRVGGQRKERHPRRQVGGVIGASARIDDRRERASGAQCGRLVDVLGPYSLGRRLRLTGHAHNVGRS